MALKSVIRISSRIRSMYRHHSRFVPALAPPLLHPRGSGGHDLSGHPAVAVLIPGAAPSLSLFPSLSIPQLSRTRSEVCGGGDQAPGTNETRQAGMAKSKNSTSLLIYIFLILLLLLLRSSYKEKKCAKCANRRKTGRVADFVQHTFVAHFHLAHFLKVCWYIDGRLISLNITSFLCPQQITHANLPIRGSRYHLSNTQRGHIRYFHNLKMGKG